MTDTSSPRDQSSYQTMGKKNLFSTLNHTILMLLPHRPLYNDEKMYPNPDNFFPDRFLEVDADGRQKQKDPRDYLFGYGPRSAHCL